MFPLCAISSSSTTSSWLQRNLSWVSPSSQKHNRLLVDINDDIYRNMKTAGAIVMRNSGCCRRCHRGRHSGLCVKLSILATLLLCLLICLPKRGCPFTVVGRPVAVAAEFVCILLFDFTGTIYSLSSDNETCWTCAGQNRVLLIAMTLRTHRNRGKVRRSP